MSRTNIVNFIIYIVIIFLLWFVIRPLLVDSKVIRESIVILETSISQEKQAIEELKALRDLVNSNKENIDNLKLAIPEERDISALIVIFEEAAAINGLVLNRIDINEKETTSLSASKGEAPTTATVNVNLNLIGGYGQFKNFLDSMERSFPLVDITKINFDVPSRGELGRDVDPFNPILDFEVGLNTYYGL